ncbi:unnamed protein product, partial [Rotaria sp. Silwood2]
FNIRDLFASYLTDIQSDERPNTSSINLTQLKSSTDDQYSNSYSILTLHSLLSFTSFYSSSVTFFFCSRKCHHIGFIDLIEEKQIFIVIHGV